MLLPCICQLCCQHLHDYEALDLLLNVLLPAYPAAQSLLSCCFVLQMLEAVTAHYAHLEDPNKPPAKMPAKKQLHDFEVLLPLINCREATPTKPAAIMFMPCSTRQRSYSISLYAADPLFTAFTYIGGRQVQAPAAAEQQQQQQKAAGGQKAAALNVLGEVWVDDRQRVQCRARLETGQELEVKAVFDKDAVQRGRRQDRLAQLSSAAVSLLRQLNYGGATAAQLEEEAAARKQQAIEAAAEEAAAAAAAAARRQQAEAAAAAAAARKQQAEAAEAEEAAAARKQQADAAAAKEAEAATAARKQQVRGSGSRTGGDSSSKEAAS
jgi:hypothetical protein